MKRAQPEPPPRKPRADAERNRKLLLQVAKDAFLAKGANASLDEIARTAGVGIGTLYRHFPTRGELVQAVYLDELAALEQAATSLSEQHKPTEALRQWMLMFVDYMVAKRIVREAIETGVAGTKWPEDAGSRIQRAMTMLTERAVKAKEIELRMEPMDLLRAIVGVATSTPGDDWEKGARQLVDVLVAGLKKTPR